MDFPGPWIDCREMRQTSRLPSLSLRDCQRINRSSQYSNSPPIESIFSITSLNLCFPWSGLSLCLCPMNAPFIFTAIMFPSRHMITWPGSTELSHQRKFPFCPNCFHAALQTPLCVVFSCTWCSNLHQVTGIRQGAGAGSGRLTIPSLLPLLISDVSDPPWIGCFSH